MNSNIFIIRIAQIIVKKTVKFINVRKSNSDIIRQQKYF